jgi:hypothetical protein
MRIKMKLNGLVRTGMVHTLSGVIPLYVVNEYPKSGGSWMGQMLSRALDLPYPRNRFPVLRSSIMHGHYLNPRGMKNVVNVWRDGRDVMVSWYHHCLFKNDLYNAPLVDIVRNEVPFTDYDDVYGNLPAFIEYVYTRQSHPRFSWAEFVRSWAGRKGIVHTSYEALRRDTPNELRRIVQELTGKPFGLDRAEEIADELSFTRLSGRQPGQEVKGRWMRKGAVGDWTNHFSPEARRLFDRYAGEELVLLGYEPDRSWASRAPERMGAGPAPGATQTDRA